MSKIIIHGPAAPTTQFVYGPYDTTSYTKWLEDLTSTVTANSDLVHIKIGNQTIFLETKAT